MQELPRRPDRQQRHTSPACRAAWSTPSAWSAFGAIVIFGFVLNVAGVTTFVERRVWARIQSRVGPNRVGPQGILQWLADGIKLLMKEDIIPADGRLAPCSRWRRTS